MKKETLPAHIRQLVDKKNYVIAIKTYAQEQDISLDDAKKQIDDYESQAFASKGQAVIPTVETNTEVASKKQGFSTLTQGLDNHLKQENIKLPLLPRWVKRVGLIIVVMFIIGWLFYRLFK